jgi:hypothetical protein
LSGDSSPSVSHLSTDYFIKDWEEPPREDLEIKKIPGTQPTTKANASREKTPCPMPQLEENPSKPDQLSSSSQAHTEEEEWLSSTNSNLEIY